jgi:hypothetical protein
LAIVHCRPVSEGFFEMAPASHSLDTGAVAQMTAKERRGRLLELPRSAMNFGRRTHRDDTGVARATDKTAAAGISMGRGAG